MTEHLRVNALTAAIKTCGESNAETVLYTAGRYLSFLTGNAERTTGSGGVGGPPRQVYRFAAIDANGREQGIVSEYIDDETDLSLKGASVSVPCPASHPGHAAVYKSVDGGPFGYVGMVHNQSVFVDDNIAPDLARTPAVASA